MLQSLLKTADQLKIKGLCESPEEKEDTPSPTLPYLSRGYSKIRRVISPKHVRQLDSINRKFNKFKQQKQETANVSEDEEDVDNKEDVLLENSSDEENDMPVTSNEESRKRKLTQTQTKPLNMSSHGLIAGQVLFNV